MPQRSALRLLVGLLLAFACAADGGLPSGPLSLGTYQPTPAGYVNTKYRDGVDGSSALTWTSIPDQTTPSGAGYSVNLCSYLTQPGSPNATISVAPGFALPNATWSLGGTNNCTLTFATPYTAGTSTVKFRATRLLEVSDTPSFLVGGISGSNPAVAPVISAVTSTGTTTPATSLRVTWGAVTNADHYICRYKHMVGTGPDDWYYDPACAYMTGTTFDITALFGGVEHGVQIGAANMGNTVVLWSSTITATPTSGSTSGQVKWHPGWYESWPNSLHWNSSTGKPDLLPTQADWNALPSDFKGMMLYLTWSTLEQSYGSYNLDWLEEQVEFATNAGKRLAFNFNPGKVSSSTSFPSDSLPSYLNDGGSVYGYSHSDYGNWARFWKPAVYNRIVAAMTQVCALLDTNANFEAIMLMETAWNIVDGTGPTQSTMVASLKELARLTVAACPHTLVTMRYNWGTAAEAQGLVAHAETYGYGVGSTDAYSTWISDVDWTLRGAGVVSGAAESHQNGQNYGTIDYRGRIPVMAANEFPPFMGSLCYAGGGGILEYTDDTYKASHLFISPQQSWSGALTCQLEAAMESAVAAYGPLGNTSCPTAIVARGGCDTT